MQDAVEDEHISFVVSLPAGTSLFQHPLVLAGKVIQQVNIQLEKRLIFVKLRAKPVASVQPLWNHPNTAL